MAEQEQDTPMEGVEDFTAAPAEVTTNTDIIPEYEPIEIPAPMEAMSAFNVNEGPRLMITHIVNENFKSYAGVTSLGPFHKSFSAIVGPNGSGKSNVIDSMLFVFGYRANKIRSKKISVLIHNSEQHKNLTSCTVAVHFQKIIDTGPGEDEFTVVPNSNFVVSRTAFKDSSSYYKVNDKKATYKEVAALLRGSGIDLDHNRFLILQGEVEQIAMMKPKALTEHEDGMLEFLEDIIGSSRFKEPIERLTERVEQLNDVRAEKLNRVKVVSKEKDELEGVKNEALGFLETENKIVHKRNKLFQKFLAEFSSAEEKAKEKMTEVEEAMKKKQSLVSELTERKKEISKKRKQIHKKQEECARSCDEKKESFAQFEKQDVRCREDLKHSHAKGKKLKKQLELEDKKLGELQQIPAKTEHDVAELQKRLDKLDVDKAAAEEKLKEVMESLKTETQDIQAEKDVKEADLAKLQKAVNETKTKYTIAKTELDLYTSQQASEERKLHDTQSNLTHSQKQLTEAKSSIGDLEKRLPDTNNELHKMQEELVQVKQKEAQANQHVREARVKVEEMRSSMESSKGRGKVLEGLLQLKKANRIPGIHGRLGDLGAIDEKYDVAISTACGSLDNIVVDSINTGQKCVEFLKKNNVGVATFIGLDKMTKWKDHCARKISTPENVPRLFDLVQVHDPAVLPAFYFALRDTLVAKDLDQATRIAYGKTRYRVVTLNGQLIDQSGTMSGGGGRVSKGRMGSSVKVDVDPRELQKLEADLEKNKTEADQCRDLKFKLETSAHQLSKEGRDIKHALEKANLKIKSLVEQEKNLKEREVEQKAAVKAAAPEPAQLKALEKSLASLKSNYDKACEKANAVEEEVHRLQKQILDIGGTMLKSAESRVQMVNTQIDQVTGHITKAKVAATTAQRNAKKCEEKVRSLKEEMTENEAHSAELGEEFKQLETDAAKVMTEHKEATEALAEVNKDLAELTEAFNAMESEEQDLAQQHMEVKHEQENRTAKLKELQTKVKHWKKELSRLVLERVDGLEVTELETFSADDLTEVDSDNVQYQITLMEEENRKLKPNMAAIDEYKRKEELYLKRVEELNRVTQLRDDQRALLEECRKRRLDDFMGGFTVITEKLKEMYQMITLGGDAELELVDSLDPFSEGIVFSVRPPKKSWKNISNLSGGEKTLSSLALVFALHHYKPTPLYVMDEIDAALDFKNVSIVANYIKERTKNAQFIIISLRNNMFELADRLIGIYKTYDATKTVTINPNKIAISV